MAAFSDAREGAILRVRVTPRCGREELKCDGKEEIGVRLTSPPVKGQANQALIKFLARSLGVGKRDIEVVSGLRSRRKTVRVRGLSAAQVQERLHRAAAR